MESFRNGDPILQVLSDVDWKAAGESAQPAWCYFDNDINHGETRGKLYNWFALNDPRGLAPEGWRIPTLEDWSILINMFGGEKTAGDALKSTSGWWENGNGSNESGFNCLPGGCRFFNGKFFNFDANAFFWCISQPENDLAMQFNIGYNYKSIHADTGSKSAGYSVRCIR